MGLEGRSPSTATSTRVIGLKEGATELYVEQKSDHVLTEKLQGRITLKTGESYNGDWDHGLPHGEGELILVNPKRIYKGTFSQGRVRTIV